MRANLPTNEMGVPAYFYIKCQILAELLTLRDTEQLLFFYESIDIPYFIIINA